jgi:hypothetical protein
MSTDDLQRVVNLSAAINFDPTGNGTKDEVFANPEFLDGAIDAAGNKHYDIQTGKLPTTGDLVSLIRKGYVPILHVGHYHAAPFAAVTDDAGKVSEWRTELIRDGGHYLAVNGFFGAGPSR